MANVQTLIHQLESANAAEQATAAEALARMGQLAQPAATALIIALRTADPPTREWCTAALEDLGSPSAVHVSELTKLAEDKSFGAAYWAITLLGRAGISAAPAVHALTNVLRTASATSLQERAAWALGKLGPAAKPASVALREATTSSNPRLVRLAKEALGEIES
jgi:hypothetical protein